MVKITEVTATCFGPFVDERLKPATGMTVVWGLNEAGKSSWHSALHIALCGLRRGRGANTLADRQVISRNQPWSGAKWCVGARVSLDDGEELTIGWDLDAKIATVIDSLGRDRSNEWMHQGAADLSKLVGLDRESFLATASVRQSDLLGAQESPDKLQNLLQRAAATGGVDATASAALDAIDRFAQVNVGLDRANSSKPLAAAKRALVEASRKAAAANEDHRHRLELVARIAGVSDEIAAKTKAEQAIGSAHRVARLGHELSVSNARDQEMAELSQDLVQIEGRERHHRDARAILEAKAATMRAEEEFKVVSAAHEEVAGLQQEVQQQGSELDALDLRVVALTAAVELAEGREALAAAEHRSAEATEAADLEDQARCELARAEEATLNAEVVLARTIASRTRTAADRASDLDQRHPTAPTAATDRDDQINAVHTAIERWAERPAIDELTGPTSSEIENQLAELPARPEGDLQPATSVIETETLWRLANDRVQAHSSSMPDTTSTAELPAEPAAIRVLAERLDAPRKDPAALQAELSASETAASMWRGSTVLLLLGALLALAGLGIGLLVGPAWFSLTLVGISLTALGVRGGFAQRKESDNSPLRAQLQTALAQERDVADAASAIVQLGLPVDSTQLRALAEAHARARSTGDAHARWQTEGVQLEAELRSAEDRLRQELLRRDIRDASDLGAALQLYRDGCTAKAAIAEHAAGRPAIEAALTVRKGIEAEVDRTRATIAQAEQALRDASHLVGEPAVAPVEALVTVLSGWLAHIQSARSVQDSARQEWMELQQLIGSGSVGDLCAKAKEAEHRSAELDRSATGIGMTVPVPEVAVDEAAQATKIRTLDEQTAKARQRLNDAEVQAASTSAAQVEAQACRNKVLASHSHLERTASVDLDDLQHLSVEQATELRQKSVAKAAAARRQQDQTLGKVQEKERSLADLNQAQAAVEAAARAYAAEQAKRLTADDVVPGEYNLETITRLIDNHIRDATTAADQAGNRRGQITERERLCQDHAPAETQYAEAVTGLERLASELDSLGLPIDPDGLPGADALEEQLDQVRTHLEELRRELSNLEGQLEERKTIGQDPGEAEERRASARDELDRVQRLDEVLKKTRNVLAAAQEQVHRNIAPRLNASTDRWMPYLFADRYQRVLIDPERLSVKVLTGQVARDATALSQGTTEQIYLLLRIALVDALTAASKEGCPMILDDITVHFDAERKVAVLDLLHRLSQERQVIIFSQEEAVRSWAQDNFGTPDRLIELVGRVQP